MKYSDKTKTKMFSLNEINNFNKELDVNVEEVMNKYNELLMEYIHFIFVNIQLTKREYVDFIVTRGLETITNIFTNILYYTKNLDLAFFHTQNALYLYVEFICQISEAEKMFLQLSSRDAMIYVYKKTLFELNQDFVKKIEECSQQTKEKFNMITTQISINKMLMTFIITTNEPREQYISLFDGLTTKMNKICFQQSQIEDLERLINMFYLKLESKEIDYFYKIVTLVLKQVSKNPDILKICQDKINDPAQTYINWFM
jgi:hypothetical protein